MPDKAALPTGEREMLVRCFETWLDRYLAPALDNEPVRQGLTSEIASALENGGPLPSIDATHGPGGCDLHSLFGAMTVLSTEVRLQGRSFKALQESVVESMRTVDQVISSARNAPEAKTDISVGTGRDPGVLIDLRDRMEQGRTAVSRAALEFQPEKMPWLARHLGLGSRRFLHARDVLGSLAHGYALTVARIDEDLLSMNVVRMRSLGAFFDPASMMAIETDTSGAAPDGTVVEVFREGYEWNGELCRTAQVRVAMTARAYAGRDEPDPDEKAREESGPDETLPDWIDSQDTGTDETMPNESAQGADPKLT